MAQATDLPSSMTIYRARDAIALDKADIMAGEPFAPAAMEGFMKVMDAGFMLGAQTDVLANLPGFSLVRAQFKKNFPLPLHSHDSDCLYYIAAGSLRMGTETLSKGDSFFVPAEVPYTYKAGPEGVDILEFRNATAFNFRNHANGQAFWDKAAETVKANKADWAAEIAAAE
jgi:quercetin dioxygenase-like cupin family protein